MPSVIFSGNKVKTLKDTLQIGNGPDIIQGTVNPQSVATAGAPSSLYMNTSTGDVFRKLDSGTSTNWQLIGAGSGGGGINFVGLDTSFKLTSVSDVDAETSVGSHVAYADAAAVSPVDMTGGSPGTTVVRSTSSPLNGAASILMDLGSGSSRQGEGHSLVVNVPTGYRGLRLEYSFAFAITGAIVEDDLRLSVYDVTNAELITDLVQVNKVMGSTGIARVQFLTKTTTAQIRVGLHIARTSTAALSVKMDDFQVGPKLSTIGLAGSDTLSQPLTFENLGTVSSNSAKTWRIGDRFYAKGTCTLGTPSGSDAYIVLPGLSIDQQKIGPETREIVGKWYRNTSGGNNFPTTQAGPFVLRHVAAEPTKISFSSSVNTAASNQIFDGLAGTSVGSSGDEITFEFDVPIDGWSSNVTMASDPAAESIGVSVGLAANVTPAAAGVIIYDSIISDPQNGYNLSTGEYTIPVTGRYLISANKFSNSASAVYVTVNGVHYPYLANGANGELHGGNIQLDLKKGDLIAIAAESSSTYTGSAGPAYINTMTISRIPGSTSIGLESVRSQVSVQSGNGYGSSGTRIRRFSTVLESIGSAITYADSSTSGASFTINEAGVYAVSYLDEINSGSTFIGVSRNASSLSSDVDSLAGAQVIIGTLINTIHSCSSVVNLNAGDVIRAHVKSGGSGLPDGTGIYTKFTITKVSN